VTRRQTTPEQWLIANGRIEAALWQVVRKLPRGSGVLLLQRPDPEQGRRLRHLARRRGLMMLVESPRRASRAHNSRELRNALLRRSPLIFLSPMWPTHSHPDWSPLPRMRAAALARLAGRRAFALGGMNAKRYAKIARLGFIGWAGISAWSRA
jgi:thiamine-phosphate pyrophosphorylase